MAINRGNGSISSSLVSSTGKPISSSAGDFVSISSPTRQANILLYGMEGTGKTSQDEPVEEEIERSDNVARDGLLRGG